MPNVLYEQQLRARGAMNDLHRAASLTTFERSLIDKYWNYTTELRLTESSSTWSDPAHPRLL